MGSNSSHTIIIVDAQIVHFCLIGSSQIQLLFIICFIKILCVFLRKINKPCAGIGSLLCADYY
jgi:hypothetical protein